MAVQSPRHKLTRNGRGWIKRINGKVRWIVSAAAAPTPADADDYYEKHFTEIWQPQPAPVTVDAGTAITVQYLIDAFHDRKERAGIDPQTLAEYDDAMSDFAQVVGLDTLVDTLTPAHFAKVRAAWSRRFGPYRLRKFIRKVRAMFRWAQHPPYRLREPDYGDEFGEPGKADFRRHDKANRDKHGAKLFTPADVTKLLANATTNLRAMILLAVNGGFGNTDLAALPLTVLDLDGGWLEYARGKTGIDRRVPLWPQTITALRDVLTARTEKVKRWKLAGKAFDPAAVGLVFVTLGGKPYIVDCPKGRTSDKLGAVFQELCETCGVERHGRNFYSLRRTHKTYADEVGDAHASNLIMGHASRDIGATYVMKIEDARLRKVVNHVRARLKISGSR